MTVHSKVPAAQWKAIDGLRRIGNIGAHMDKDVSHIVDIDPGEAQKLIALTELLLRQWYVERYDAEELYDSIASLDASKQDARRSG